VPDQIALRPSGVTAFAGVAASGPIDTPTSIRSFADFARAFGGLAAASTLSYAVLQFFANGGREAIVVRVDPGRRALTDADLAPLVPDGRGLHALAGGPAFDLLCVPPPTRTGHLGPDAIATASQLAEARLAMLVLDAPASWRAPGDAATGPDALASLVSGARRANVAVYAPRLRLADPLAGNGVADFPPAAAVAGRIARTDLEHGVWTSPAGTEATIAGARGVTAALSSDQIGSLADLGVNVLREVAGHGTVIWGARTLDGAAGSPSDWRFVAVRRLALLLSASIEAGLAWTTFEPNAEPLWVRVRAAVEDLLLRLYVAGAFPARKPDEAYFVRCDRSTTTQADLDAGRLNVLVGFAPLKPAEFVILRFALQAGQGIPIPIPGPTVPDRPIRVRLDGRVVARFRASRPVLAPALRVRRRPPASASSGPAASSLDLLGGAALDPALEAWARLGRRAPDAEVRLEVLAADGRPALALRLTRARPDRWTAPTLNAEGTETEIGTLMLSHDGLELAPTDEPS
jgi:hypothetical protein